MRLSDVVARHHEEDVIELFGARTLDAFDVAYDRCHVDDAGSSDPLPVPGGREPAAERSR